MKVLQNQELIASLVKRNQSFIDVVENKFSKLSEEQLLTKPAPDKWSISECLIHIIKADEIYTNQFESKIQEKPVQDLSYKPGWLGNWFAEGIVPKNGKITNGMKSLKVMDPQRNMAELQKEFPSVQDVLEKFVVQQNLLNKQMQKAVNNDLGSIKIQTAIPLIKIKLGDALRFVVGHNERHIFQAEGVYASIENL
ncbi:MAG: DinB family protein [Chitinophagales bacterium]